MNEFPVYFLQWHVWLSSQVTETELVVYISVWSSTFVNERKWEVTHTLTDLLGGLRSQREVLSLQWQSPKRRLYQRNCCGWGICHGNLGCLSQHWNAKVHHGNITGTKTNCGVSIKDRYERETGRTDQTSPEYFQYLSSQHNILTKPSTWQTIKSTTPRAGRSNTKNLHTLYVLVYIGGELDYEHTENRRVSLINKEVAASCHCWALWIVLEVLHLGPAIPHLVCVLENHTCVLGIQTAVATLQWPQAQNNSDLLQ